MRSGNLKPLARSLRQNQTDAEKLLWSRLRSNRLFGMKFRRQLPLGPFIADFCALENKLIIELDGGQHSGNNERDGARTRFLEKEGFRVIRVWNHEVLANLEGVLEYIRVKIQNSPSPRPVSLTALIGKGPYLPAKPRPQGRVRNHETDP